MINALVNLRIYRPIKNVLIIELHWKFSEWKF